MVHTNALGYLRTSSLHTRYCNYKNISCSLLGTLRSGRFSILQLSQVLGFCCCMSGLHAGVVWIELLIVRDWIPEECAADISDRGASADYVSKACGRSRRSRETRAGLFIHELMFVEKARLEMIVKAGFVLVRAAWKGCLGRTLQNFATGSLGRGGRIHWYKFSNGMCEGLDSQGKHVGVLYRNNGSHKAVRLETATFHSGL